MAKATRKKPKSKKKTGGRPCKIDNPETMERLVEAIESGAKYELACSHAGITYRTFRNWMVKGETAKSGKFFHFFQAIKKAEAKGAMKDLTIISDAAKKDWKAAAWRLERRHGYTKPKHEPELSPMSPEEEELLQVSLNTLVKAIKDGDARAAMALLVKLFDK